MLQDKKCLAYIINGHLIVNESVQANMSSICTTSRPRVEDHRKMTRREQDPGLEIALGDSLV